MQFCCCRCDVSSASEADQIVRECRREYSLDGCLHAGGILNDALLTRQTSHHVRQVYAPKHYGALNLAQV